MTFNIHLKKKINTVPYIISLTPEIMYVINFTFDVEKADKHDPRTQNTIKLMLIKQHDGGTVSLSGPLWH